MPEDFFQQEQKAALQAMKNCCREAWQVVQQDTNLKPLIRKRPLVSLAAAAAGGLVAGYLLTPPQGGRPKREPREGGEREGKKRRHRGFLVTLEDELAGAITPTLRTLAASTAGALFSGVHQGYRRGREPAPAEYEPADIPQHRIQI